MNAKRILMLVSDYVEGYEVMVPFQVLLMVRHDVHAICHGAQVLAATGVLKGKKCTAYPVVGPDIKGAGGKWVDVPVDKAHVDGHLVAEPA